MADHRIMLIPEDPLFVPDETHSVRARQRLMTYAPHADEVTYQVSNGVTFFDCGQNFEHVYCPNCSAGISLQWWQERMGEDYDNDAFKLDTYETPCCNSYQSLHDLKYIWQQGFGQFSLQALNPNMGKLTPEHKEQLEAALEAPLREIHQYI